MKDLRLEAFRILWEILEEEGYSNIVLSEYRAKTEAEHTSFVFQLVYGVLENLPWLDYVVKQRLTGSGKLDREIDLILKMGTYEILCNRTPDFAAINETVNLCAKVRKKSAKGLVNAILRRIAREEKTIRAQREQLPAEIKYNMPKWILAAWQNLFDDEVLAKILAKVNDKPPFFIRISKKFDEEQILKSLAAFNPMPTAYSHIYEIERPEGILDTEEFKSLAFVVQDLSSYLVASTLEICPGMKVLDMCSAPGGKTMVLSENTENGEGVTAADLYDNKVHRMKKTLSRAGYDQVETVVQDGTEFREDWVERYDGIVLDAPCSGLGVIRRRPEIKYNRKLSDVKALQMLQRRLLDRAIDYLKVDGVLVFSVCTWTEEETLAQLEYVRTKQELEVIEDRFLGIPPEEGDGFYYIKCKKVSG